MGVSAPKKHTHTPPEQEPEVPAPSLAPSRSPSLDSRTSPAVMNLLWNRLLTLDQSPSLSKLTRASSSPTSLVSSTLLLAVRSSTTVSSLSVTVLTPLLAITGRSRTLGAQPGEKKDTSVWLRARTLAVSQPSHPTQLAQARQLHLQLQLHLLQVQLHQEPTTKTLIPPAHAWLTKLTFPSRTSRDPSAPQLAVSSNHAHLIYQLASPLNLSALLKMLPQTRNT